MAKSQNLRSYREYMRDSIKDPLEAAAYLNAAAESDDSRAFLLALKDVIDVHGGVSQLARKTKLNRGNLYRILSGKGFPRFDNLTKLLDASGFVITIQPKKTAGKNIRAANTKIATG